LGSFPCRCSLRKGASSRWPWTGNWPELLDLYLYCTSIHCRVSTRRNGFFFFQTRDAYGWFCIRTFRLLQYGSFQILDFNYHKRFSS
jgi:hypothetical protein